MKLWVLPLVFYFMAFMAICVEFLPGSALAMFGGPIEGDTRTITSISVLVFGGIGALLHLVLYRRNPERFETALMIKVGAAMVLALAGMFLVSAVVSASTDASPAEIESRTRDFMSWLGIVIAGGMLLLLVGAAVGFYVLLKFHPLNRMSRKLQAEDYTAAISIGERALRKSENAGVAFNLAVAYLGDGRPDRARVIYEDLAAAKEVPDPFTEDTYREALETLNARLHGIETQRSEE